MKPYIISHMMESVDGRIDCAMTEQIDATNSYYDALDSLECPTHLMGRVTMQMHYADAEPYVAVNKTPVGREVVYRAVKAAGYMVAVDTHGSLRWSESEYYGRPLLVVTSESCPKEYLEYLTERHISYIAVGAGHIDLARAMELLNTEFGVERLAVTGGGHINGAFLAAGLLDEVSVMIGAGIDGRKGMAAVFDGIEDKNRPATLLRLQSVRQVNDGTIWLRYTIID